ncbi:MAG: CDP-alcohol phosphatidyltransferase family protein [Spirochaetales bacterium]|uniref:CDP-alcohol phosphatidyltransferase family protein n=1 Tax=Candidatus Thalassospirochaeta sargassi TaxID=3119039 RepID=A0AAJ1MJP2_9SPIO|nr:CDP-alcohol phosphatidyltransferase family protein [Spirochaetales bacterium]
MLDKIMRPLKDRFLTPFVSLIAGSFSPNAITLISFLFALASAGFLLMRMSGWALALWALNRIFDGLDGAVARHQNRQTDFGGYLDIMLDFITYALLPLVFTLRYGMGESTWLALAVMLGLFYVNAASWMYLSSLLEKNHAGASIRGEQTSVAMPSGLVEGTETIIIYTLLFIIPGRMTLLFYVMSAALVPGILFRLVWAKKNLH